MPRVITRDQVKRYLGVTDTSLDTQIDQYLPIVDAAVKQITRRKWNDRYRISTTATSTEARVLPAGDDFGDTDARRMRTSNIGNPYSLSFTGDTLEPGQSVTGDNFATDTHLVDVFIQEYRDYSHRVFSQFNKLITIELSKPATATGTEVAIVGMNVAFFPVISKAVNWFIAQENRTNPDAAFRTKRVGPLTLTLADLDAQIDGRFGVPSWLVKALPKYMVGY